MKNVLFAEWIEHRKDYRVWANESPQQTIAYVDEDDLNDLSEYADLRGYELQIID